MAHLHDLDEALELLHFGFRAIIAGPDRDLERRGLGRVHHRILYFVRRNDGLTIGDLLRILGVTKQALHGPLHELVAKGLVMREPDAKNRRLVRLRLSREGAAFERRLSGAQRRHFERVFTRVGKRSEQGWCEVMRLLGSQQRPGGQVRGATIVQSSSP
jgi:DNA-binding MarR family transcriptional regulator